MTTLEIYFRGRRLFRVQVGLPELEGRVERTEARTEAVLEGLAAVGEATGECYRLGFDAGRRRGAAADTPGERPQLRLVTNAPSPASRTRGRS